MKAKFVAFGVIEIDGERFEHDVVIEAGRVSKRKKKASKPFREQFGHTPLSDHEHIPWGGRRLLVGTGMYGRLPVMPAVLKEAKRRHIKLVVVPTEEACQLLSEPRSKKAYAILHATC